MRNTDTLTRNTHRCNIFQRGTGFVGAFFFRPAIREQKTTKIMFVYGRLFGTVLG